MNKYIYSINTNGNWEDNFNIYSSLTEKQICDVIKPIIFASRDGILTYDNLDLEKALKQMYPDQLTEIYFAETITI